MKEIKLNIQLFADGKVVIETDLDKGGFESGLDKMQSLAKTGFKAIATSVGVASTAIAGLVGKSVTMAGELEQNVGGAEAVFGDLYTDLTQIDANLAGLGEGFTSLEVVSLNAFKNMGLSTSDYLATINKMGSLMQGAGLETKDAMNLSAQAMQRAADVASIMGIDVNAAMESVAGAAKGNFTMMDNLGVAMNATTIEAYALSKGITESYNSMDNATKVGLAMEMFLEKTSYAAGNYAKENKTFAGSFTTLKAATSNFLSGAGGIEDVADALVDFGGILVESIGNMAPTIIEGMLVLTEELIPQIPILFEALLPAVLEGAIGLINGLVAIFPALISLIQENLPTIIDGGITILIALVNGILQSLPQLIPAVLQAVLLIVDSLIDNIDLIVDAGIEVTLALAEGLIEALPELIDKIPIIIDKLVGALIDNGPKILAAGVQLIIQLGVGLIKAIPQLLAKVPEIIGKLFSRFVELLGTFVNIGKYIVEGIWQGISNGYEWIKNKISGWVGDILGFFKRILGIASPSKVMRDEIGIFLAQGLGVGFDKEIGSVYDDMQKAVDIEMSKMNANVETSGTYQMAMSGMPTFNLVDNASNTTQLVVNGKVLAEVVNTENRNREVATA